MRKCVIVDSRVGAMQKSPQLTHLASLKLCVPPQHLPIPSSRALAAITLVVDFANLAILDPSSKRNHMVLVPGLADWHFISQQR